MVFTVPEESMLLFSEHMQEILSMHRERPSESKEPLGGQSKSQAEGAKAMPQPKQEVSVSKEVDCPTAEALRLLMGEDFTSQFTTQEKGNRVVIACNRPGARSIMDKVDTLRQEDVQLPRDELRQLKSPWNATEEGVPACFVPLHDQGKVTVFSFDYNAMAKAKHLLSVKVGKVKVTARGRRRFEDKGDDTGSDVSPPTSLSSSVSAQPMDFTTKSGMKVSVYKTDITRLPVEVIVNAANEQLAHHGGVAFAISTAAGFALEDEGRDHIRTNGPLKVSEVVATTAGNLPCKKVLHAVGPRWADYKDKGLCEKVLADTVYNCLVKAHSMNFTSMAIPSISSGIACFLSLCQCCTLFQLLLTLF
jgi:O-acetyl-ADP-ribose deacetylase (regulator of RNase III)